MRLKSIKLAGFKSFVDPTVVKFSSNMSAVVGPNGCGKSNIIDAVRWVMGESSAKNLRGQAMTDVIFNGSNSRKPAGQASIELVFDNSDGSLVGEYAAYSEIAIRRSVNREAQSSYQLNGSRCRRRDITDIFLGTGLGPRSYAIIEQGMISKLIEARPDELRTTVEEAAGISRYKERRRDTENRMRRTRENLERLNDIREELERQLQNLQRQARTAERYRALKAEQRVLEAQLMALQWRGLDGRVDDAASAIRQRELGLEEQLSLRASAENAAETLRSRHHEQTDAFNAVQTAFYQIGADIARAEQQLQHQQERDRQLRQDLALTEDSLREAERHLANDQAQLDDWRAELDELAPQLQARQSSERDSADALRQLEDERQRRQQRWDQFNEAATGRRHRADIQQSKIQHLDQVVRRLGERLHKLQSERKAWPAQADDEALLTHRQALAAAESQLEREEQLRAELLDRVPACREQERQVGAELDRLRREFHQIQGRKASLEALQQAALGQGEAGGEWLGAHGLSGRDQLADALQVDAGWEVAVETVLGGYLQAVSIDSIDALAGEIAGCEGVTLAFVEAQSPAAQRVEDNTVLPPLTDHVRGASSLLSGILCGEDLAQALQQRHQLRSGQSVVTRDGIWVGANWLRVARDRDAHSGVIARRTELAALAEREAALQTALDETVAGRLQLAEELERLEADRRQIEAAIREAGAEQSRAASALTAFEVRIEQQDLRRRRLEQDLDEVGEQLELEQEELAEARLLLQDALDAMAEDTDQRDALLAQRDDARARLEHARALARDDQQQAQQLAMRQHALTAQLASTEQGIDRLGAQLEQLRGRRATALESIDDNLAPMDELRETLEANLAEHVQAQSRLDEARHLLESTDAQLAEAESRRQDAQQQIECMRGELEQQRLDLRTLEVQRKALQDQLSEAHSLDEVLAELPGDASESQWSEQIERLGNRIARLGAINLAAIDEYRAQGERKHFLDAQHGDLSEALATLEQAIGKIDRETRQRFKETFTRINEGLQALFPQVFGGGHAYLELTGDDLLDTGIAIMARPPGKRNSSIQLLSGGEKALTAIALVFAIFRLNPAPFCMLDEVDAPLDDANTGRYARIVKEMSANVQFIFITHNKITMEFADQLMGVTMHEPGCSRLVTVDIDAAAELAAV